MPNEEVAFQTVYEWAVETGRLTGDLAGASVTELRAAYKEANPSKVEKICAVLREFRSPGWDPVALGSTGEPYRTALNGRKRPSADRDRNTACYLAIEIIRLREKLGEE